LNFLIDQTYKINEKKKNPLLDSSSAKRNNTLDESQQRSVSPNDQKQSPLPNSYVKGRYTSLDRKMEPGEYKRKNISTSKDIQNRSNNEEIVRKNHSIHQQNEKPYGFLIIDAAKKPANIESKLKKRKFKYCLPK
jgi:hypothetical protein